MRPGLKALVLAALVSVTLPAGADPMSGQGTWERTLQGRDLDGNPATFEAYYDTVLGITWLADANAAAGSSFDDGPSVTDGRMTWGNATAWAESLTFSGAWGSANDWRLPDTSPVNGSSYNYSMTFNGSTDRGYNISRSGSAYSGSTASELAYLYYNTLGNVGYYDTTGTGPQASWSGTPSAGPFSNVQSWYYWSGTSYPPDPSNAWLFDFGDGYQNITSGVLNEFYAWAVHDGDVGAVADPGTLLQRLLSDATKVGPGKSLADKVTLAQTYYAVPDVQATCAVLTDFVNEVRAQQGKKITAGMADQLTADAQAIMAAIGCD